MYFVPAEELETSANSRAQHYRARGVAPSEIFWKCFWKIDSV